MATTYERLCKMETRIHEVGFTTPRGIGSEIPHFVFDYPAEDELEVRSFVRRLVDQTSLNICNVNLFELFLHLFEDEIDDLMELGDEEGYEGLVEATETVLDHQQTLVNAFLDQVNDAELVLITGVGSAFPFIRSSQLLKLLASIAYRRPIVLFYPGYFTGLQLRLFNRIMNEDQYQLSRIS
ncbi:DUF1788 domain-containing protein [Paenibacillus herberti]|uniref:Cytoplasmic protein n=1 Tax=Paenibacillus herberti TaxID=1619309 RepID=A0A229NTU3_9BACL|nr:DUF1788 domain-containing protein [Paenibacillus herberti]OXM13286.1 hypothetical protein CGZ75_19635 [Paenibacillus herberti]